MIGVFADILPGGVNWSKSAKTIANELVRQNNDDVPMRVEVRPANFGYTDSTGKKTTTLVAIFAPVAIMAEVRGICSHLAYDTADKEGLSLASSQFHSMKQLRKKEESHDIILSRHKKFISNYSTCTISAETYELDSHASTNLCRINKC